MEYSELVCEINKYDGYIDSNLARVRELEKQIDELDYLKTKMNGELSKLSEFKGYFTGKIQEAEIFQVSVNSFIMHNLRMRDKLSGNNYAKTIESIELAIRDINNKKEELENEIAQLRRSIDRYEAKIDGLKYELRKADK